MIKYGITSIACVALTAAIALAATTPTTTKPGMPNSWDDRIPVPQGAVLTSQTEPKGGVVHSATFICAGDYDQLVAFYESGLKHNGFEMTSPVKVPARKVYSVSFTRPGVQDNLVISPSPQDPSKFQLRVAYDPGPEKSKHPHLARLRDWWSMYPHWWRSDSHIWKSGKEWLRRRREAAAAARAEKARGAEPKSSAAPSPSAGS